MVSHSWIPLPIKNAHPPQNVLNADWYSAPEDESDAYPNAPHSVNPIAPMRLNRPICQPVRGVPANEYGVR
jgi:hypothetical protein